jgi:hypothetical protein
VFEATLTVKVEVVGEVIGLRLKLKVTREVVVLADKVTAPAYPFNALTEIVEAPLLPSRTVRLLGLAESV